ncbi:hypothetical protein J6590_061377 [Homalodisca vitripennis]|nr:hypothetical protein J6590_092926 [Homalodisca vitripennis]KAG8315953.1 hypothetical protein J6590_061377 [Homalodisca vitripennis]
MYAFLYCFITIILLAFTGLWRVWGDAKLKESVRAIQPGTRRPFDEFGAPKIYADEHVKDGDQGHRHHEEEAGGDVEGVLNELPLERALRRLRHYGAIHVVPHHYTELDRLQGNISQHSLSISVLQLPLERALRRLRHCGAIHVVPHHYTELDRLQGNISQHSLSIAVLQLPLERALRRLRHCGAIHVVPHHYTELDRLQGNISQHSLSIAVLQLPLERALCRLRHCGAIHCLITIPNWIACETSTPALRCHSCLPHHYTELDRLQGNISQHSLSIAVLQLPLERALCRLRHCGAIHVVPHHYTELDRLQGNISQHSLSIAVLQLPLERALCRLRHCGAIHVVPHHYTELDRLQGNISQHSLSIAVLQLHLSVHCADSGTAVPFMLCLITIPNWIACKETSVSIHCP